MRVLVVEDDPAVRHVIDRALTQRGHSVLVAAHAGEAWGLLLDFPDPPHVVLIDLALPGTPGLRLAGRLVTAFPTIRRVVFMTGRLDHPDVALAETKGAVLAKPFAVDALVRLIDVFGRQL